MQHVIVKDIDTFNELIDFLESHSNLKMAFDLETDSVSEIQANIYGVGLALHDEEGYYIPIRDKTGQYYFSDTPYIFNRLNSLLTKCDIIGHNVIYDVLVWKHSTGVDLTERVFADTILMKHTVDEEPPFGLKEVAVREFGEGADLAQQELYENIKANGGSTTKTNMQMFKADTDVLGKYCAHDCLLTYKLFNLYSKKLEQEGLLKFFYEEEVMPLYKEVTIPMKYYGIRIDVEFLSNLGKEIEQQLEILNTQIFDEIKLLVKDFELNYLQENYPIKRTGSFPKMYAKVVGLDLSSTAKKTIEAISPETQEQIQFKAWMQGEIEELSDLTYQAQMLWHETKTGSSSIFNLGSKAHLKWLFFNKLGLDPLSKTEKGEPQVDDNFLESVALKFSWAEKLRDKNKLEKIKGTYVGGILEKVVNGKIYTSMLQFGTTSGRYASRSPNCLSLDTQILTLDGWKNYDEVSLETKVACFDGKSVIFENPTAHYISDTSLKEMITITNQHFDIRVTANHRMVYKARKTGKLSVVPATEHRKDSTILHGATYDGGTLELPEQWLRFLIAAQADGHLDGPRVNFTFLKKRKFDRLLPIIKDLGLRYRDLSNAKRFRVVIYDIASKVKEHLGPNKTFPSSWINFNEKSRALFLEEIMYWDGSFTRKQNYSSNNQDNADLVQALFSLSGKRAHKRVYYSKQSKFPNYQIDVTNRNYSMTANSEVVLSSAEEAVWCVTVPTGMILVRRGSDTFITGNCQNLPRPKDEDSGLSELVLKYNNSIRKAFISDPDWIFVDCDESALEPRCFAHMSGDPNLQSIFHSGEDMYSSIAKRVYNLDNVSSFKKDDNFLGKLYPEKRQVIKALALAVTYGAEANRIAALLGIEKEEAQKLIDDYLKAYPSLKKYIADSHYQACTKGKVSTIFGRVRHLPEVKEMFDQFGHNLLDARWAKMHGVAEERRIFKSKLNNSTNFRIQGLAAHIVNRAMLQINRGIKSKNLKGYVCLQIHDQIVVHCPKIEAEETKKIVQYWMENVVKISVPLVAEPQIAYNLKDGH